MIIESHSTDNILPHRKNILSVHNRICALEALEDLDPTYAGGYPLALFLGPRRPKSPNQLMPGYYTDIDIYPESAARLEELDGVIRERYHYSMVERPHITANAISYMIDNGYHHTIKLQIIKLPSRFGSPVEVLEGFDFVNCAVAFKPKSETVYFHADIAAYHTQNELQVLNPWMLDEVSAPTVLTQILRFQKYCDRWQYTLSKDSLTKLLKLYNADPHLAVKEGEEYLVGSGGKTMLSPAGVCIWQIMQPYILNSPYWNPNLDHHGYLKGIKLFTTKRTTTESPLPKDDWSETSTKRIDWSKLSRQISPSVPQSTYDFRRRDNKIEW